MRRKFINACRNVAAFELSFFGSHDLSIISNQLESVFCLLLSAFCFLLSAPAYCLLLTAYCLLIRVHFQIIKVEFRKGVAENTRRALPIGDRINPLN